MNSPYATIIVPIIDRAETLAVSVETGLAQTCRNIEFLIACCGATRQVLDVAHGFARRDNRVSVIDAPASPVSTATARAEALRRARSDRIFILQDDDLWFPHHVDTFGALLDGSDIATSVTMAATLSGGTVAWPCTFENFNYRSAYAKGLGKALYEAHYAFRRSCYDKLDVGWHRQISGDCSGRLIGAPYHRSG
jgi:glycosyltransferase involved in cell wall biosynthesis